MPGQQNIKIRNCKFLTMDIKLTKSSRDEFNGSKALKLNRIFNPIPRVDKCIRVLGIILRSDVTLVHYELHLMLK